MSALFEPVLPVPVGSGHRANLPPLEVCHLARDSKDARFDGLFFTAVRSTRVYCRSVCPAPTCKRTNVVYYPTAAAAQAAGYRPCLRCRPELAPAPNVDDDADLRRALALIATGFLADAPVDDLAREVGLSSRHLRRRFVERLGATPMAVHSTQRLLLAKQLLTDTDWPVSQVASAAGFTSARRFNAAFQDGYRMSPREVRRRALPDGDFAMSLRLHYRPPFDFSATLSHLARHAMPGVEFVGDASYQRGIGKGDRARWLRVSQFAGRPELRLELFGVPPEEIPSLVQRVRRLFDLDADLAAVAQALSHDAELASLVARHPGLRLPGVWDGLELTVALLLETHINAPLAGEQLSRLIGTHGGVHAHAPPGLGLMFPRPERLAVAQLENLGIPALAAQSIRSLCVAVRDGELHFGVGQERDNFVRRLCAAAGLAPPQAHWVALRALGDPDACPLTGSNADRAASWRPWRAYASLYAAIAGRTVQELLDV